MAPIQLEADYLVLGAGAMGMAFVDSILTHMPSKTVVLVDQHGQPGGHWNDAYPYVRLHQPSAFYGVNSRRLERTDNFLELSSRNEVLAYYEAVLEGFLATGRVQFHPMCFFDDTTSRSFHSLVEPDRVYTVSSKAKIVDATYMKVLVPSISNPQDAKRYTVADDAEVVPLNALPFVGTARQTYVIIGAGKSGMDALLWLLNNQVSPERITWIMPRDAWVINRDIFEARKTMDGFDMFQLMDLNLLSTDTDDYYRRAEELGFWQRIDPNVEPTRNKCATVSSWEMEQLRRVKNVLRLGRLSRVEREQLIFAKGDVVSVGPGALFVDCSADGLNTRPAVPVFQGDRITLQAVNMCQQVFSAGLLGYIEARADLDDEAKNKLSKPVPQPDTKEDVIVALARTSANKVMWEADSGVAGWLKQARLYADSPKHGPPLSVVVPFMLRNITKVPKLVGMQKKIGENFQRMASKL